MNLLLLDPEEIAPDGRVILVDRRARHIVDVLRAQPGSQLRVGVVRGATGTAAIETITPSPPAHGQRPRRSPSEPYRVALSTHFDSPAPAPPRVDLILAVPRPKALPRIIQSAAALGVGRIDLINAWRVDKSYLSAHKLQPDVLAQEARLGCEQGGTTWVPEIAVHPLLMPFLNGPLEARLNAVDIALIAHPRDAVAIETLLWPGRQARVALAVGPEGGWIERELSTFAERGFRAVSCSARTLRVETAVSALLAQLDLLARLS